MKNKILILGMLALMSVNVNAGWIKYRDKAINELKYAIKNTNTQNYSNYQSYYYDNDSYDDDYDDSDSDYDDDHDCGCDDGDYDYDDSNYDYDYNYDSYYYY